MASKGLLFMKDYRIYCRIKGEYFDRILMGEKRIEWRFASKHWATKCKKAQHCIDNGIPVFIMFLCGRETATFQVPAIGLFHVRLDFWINVGLVPPAGTDRQAWGILLGDRVGSSLRTGRFFDTLPTRKIKTPAYLEAVQCIMKINRKTR